ncbi:MAG: serine/threonine-protein kinase [Nannocystaceae bacterium]|nr:serine/threonine-protein kinase [Nannocystaceae bacterium]
MPVASEIDTADGVRRRDPDADALAQTAAGPTATPGAARPMFGRYLVIDRLGRGAMGEVALAYDPDLDRKVALKRVRVRDRPGSQERLMGEAQAMAKIRHPNVVAVFDVGQLDDEVFIAMELVEGRTLRAWMAGEPPIDDIVEVFAQAAQGLAAAHALGIVHRDFKPDNAMIDPDGRVQVLDFGLAASLVDPRGGDAQPHATAGTPAYMAPEQFEGRPADAASDQFSLCVSMFEALHGARPFQGDDLPALCEAVIHGRLTEPARPRRLPRWLDEALRRGLQREPSARWPSLAALLEAFERGRARQRRRRRAAIAVAAAAPITVLAWLAGRTTEHCADAGAPVDALWHESARTAVLEAFASAPTPLGRTGGGPLVLALDDRAQRWHAAYVAACQLGDGDEAAALQLADRRRVCLHEQLGVFSATLDVLSRADADVVEHAARLLDALPQPQACDEPPIARRTVDPAERERVLSIAASASSLLVAGKAAPARALLMPALDELAGSATARAQLGVLAARALREQGQPDAALAPLEAAYLAARELDDRWQTMQVAIEYANNHLGRRQGEPARLWLVRARVEAQALGDARTLAMLDGHEGRALGHLGRYEEAIAKDRAALEALDALGLGNSIEAFDVISNLGGHYFSARQFDRALASKHDALQRATAIYGDDHPVAARIIADLGTIHGAMEQPELARRELLRAVAMLEASVRAPHPVLGDTLASLAGQAARDRDPAAAVAYGERALANLEPTVGRETQSVALVYNNQALALELLGRHAEAVDAMRRSIEIKQRVLPADHPDLALSLSNFAELIAPDGDDAAVRALFERALAIRESNGNALRLATLRADFAMWLATHGERERARTLAQQVLATAEASDDDRNDARKALANADR